MTDSTSITSISQVDSHSASGKDASGRVSAEASASPGWESGAWTIGDDET